jgi:hypothetical protein
MIQSLKLVATSFSLETGADEQATKPAVGPFWLLVFIYQFLYLRRGFCSIQGIAIGCLDELNY